MAKIKKPPGHDYNPFRHKPRGISHTSFKKVYWPYLPLLLVTMLIIGVTSHTGGFDRIIHNRSHVLGYATSVNAKALLADTNAQRSNENLPDLSLSPRLDQAAQAKANDMAKRDYWSHNTPEGKTPWIFVDAASYHYQKLGENLAAGFVDSSAVINAWIASPTHRQNLMDSSYSDVGFGFANIANYKAAGGGPMTIVVAMYGQPSTSKSAVISPSANVSEPPATTLTPTNGKALADSISRAELAFAKSPWAPFATSIVAIAFIGALGTWLVKHTLAFRRAWLKSERFVIRHPALDLFLLAVVVLSLILSQTAGYIQ